MTKTSIETSPQVYARIAGALYLVIIVLGLFAQVFVRDRIVVAGDAMATAAHLASMEALWRVGVACELLAVSCTIALAALYYFLLRPVSKELNLLATLFRTTAIVVQAGSLIGLLTALVPISSTAFTPDQQAALAVLAIRSHGYGYTVALLFTGCTFLVHGRLIFKSGYLPRVLGLMIQLAGVGYIANGLAVIAYPRIAGSVFVAIVLPVLIGEISLSLWLLVKGVSVEKWNERVRGAPACPVSG